MSDYCLALGTVEGYSGYDPPIEADVKAKVAEVCSRCRGAVGPGMQCAVAPRPHTDPNPPFPAALWFGLSSELFVPPKN
jgi:hypothetical protein